MLHNIGDIVIIKEKDLIEKELSEIYGKVSEKLLYKVIDVESHKNISDHIINIYTKGTSEHWDRGWRVYGESFRTANKKDLKKYLDFIFTNDKIWIKFDNTSEGNIISKVINKKYSYELLTLPEDIKKYNSSYFNRTQLWQNINEDEWLKKGYHIIEFKDIRYIINKIHGK